MEHEKGTPNPKSLKLVQAKSDNTAVPANLQPLKKVKKKKQVQAVQKSQQLDENQLKQQKAVKTQNQQAIIKKLKNQQIKQLNSVQEQKEFQLNGRISQYLKFLNKINFTNDLLV